jgi:hypothetical protein
LRVLIASSSTIPGYSGGWTTPLDLLGTGHQAFYLISHCRPGLRRTEGVPYLGLGLRGRRFSRAFPERVRCKLERELVPRAIKQVFRRFKADFVMCLDEDAGLSAMKTGLPYVMRFHVDTRPDLRPQDLELLLKNALFSTACNSTSIPGAVTLFHNEDLSRFSFSGPAKPERALLLSVLNQQRRPLEFIEGVMSSRSMKGDIIGTGPMREEVAGKCAATEGRVRLLPPVSRLRTGELSGRYQIGVATLAPRDRPMYQMKINMYMASGMHVLTSPWTEAAHLAPDLVEIFRDTQELSEKMDDIQDNWEALEDRRRRARDWVNEQYSIETPRKIFNDLLTKHFPGRQVSS